MRKTVCVFCGSHLGEDPAFKELAESLGTAIGSHEMDLVFGGGGTGLMGIVSQAALSAGAHVTGVIPEILYNVERPEANLSKLIITPTMAERKRLMGKMADYFVVLPGGIGTMEETFEVLTSNWLGIFKKPLGFLDFEGYYDDLFRFLGNAQNKGFISKRASVLWPRSTDPAELLDILQTTQLPE